MVCVMTHESKRMLSVKLKDKLMTRFPLTPILLGLCLGMPVVVSADAIDDIAPGHWYEIPNSNLDQVAPDVIPLGSTGLQSVMGSWSGGAFDTSRNRLIIWGGGHGNYAGNEVYVFDIDTVSWTRLTEPSSLSGWTDGDKVYSDGRPVSRHTYDYIEYLPPPVDALFVGGGGGLWEGAHNDPNTYLFNFASNTWTTLSAKMPSSSSTYMGIGAISALDVATGKIWFHDAGSPGTILSEFDPVTLTWTKHGGYPTEPDGFIDYKWNGALDPIRRKLVAIGNGKVYVWDLTKKGNIANTKLATTGATEIISTASPGFEYDPIGRQFVAWFGGADVYTLNMDTAVWTKVTPASGNTVVPSNPVGSGVFGRFRYVPSKNVFIVVSRVTENVFVYRLSGPLSKSVPNKPAKPDAAL